MLTGQAKTSYQREYMRLYRARRRSNAKGLTEQAGSNKVGLTRVECPGVGDNDGFYEFVVSEQFSKSFTGPLTKERQVSRKGFND